MVHGIGNPVVALQVRLFEAVREWLSHDPDVEWWINVGSLIPHRSLVADCFNLLIHLPKFVVDIHVSDSVVLRTLWRSPVKG